MEHGQNAVQIILQELTVVPTPHTRLDGNSTEIAANPVPGWRAVCDSEGRLYFHNPTLRVITFTDIRVQRLLEYIRRALTHIYRTIQGMNPSMIGIPEGQEIYLEVLFDTEGQAAARYYLVDRFRQQICWLAQELPPRFSFVHDGTVECIQYRVANSRLYWQHIGLFSQHIAISAHLVDELVVMFAEIERHCNLPETPMIRQGFPFCSTKRNKYSKRLAKIRSNMRSSAMTYKAHAPDINFIAGIAFRICDYYAIDPNQPSSSAPRPVQVPRPVIRTLLTKVNPNWYASFKAIPMNGMNARDG